MPQKKKELGSNCLASIAIAIVQFLEALFWPGGLFSTHQHLKKIHPVDKQKLSELLELHFRTYSLSSYDAPFLDPKPVGL